jgi:hypothetical protein
MQAAQRGVKALSVQRVVTSDTTPGTVVCVRVLGMSWEGLGKAAWNPSTGRGLGASTRVVQRHARAGTVVLRSTYRSDFQSCKLKMLARVDDLR